VTNRRRRPAVLLAFTLCTATAFVPAGVADARTARFKMTIRGVQRYSFHYKRQDIFRSSDGSSCSHFTSGEGSETMAFRTSRAVKATVTQRRGGPVDLKLPRRGTRFFPRNFFLKGRVNRKNVERESGCGSSLAPPRSHCGRKRFGGLAAMLTDFNGRIRLLYAGNRLQERDVLPGCEFLDPRWGHPTILLERGGVHIGNDGDLRLSKSLDAKLPARKLFNRMRKRVKVKVKGRFIETTDVNTPNIVEDGEDDERLAYAVTFRRITKSRPR
jgi:hypothetical protein